MAIELPRYRKHLHAAINQRRHREQSPTDHGQDQVTNIVLWQRQTAAEEWDDAEQVGVLPLVRHGHGVM